jgi:hypothetical protein
MKTAKELIQTRESLINNIKKNWDRIRIENVVEAGQTRNYNVQALYKSIINDSLALVEAKLDIQLVNIGFKKREEMPASCIYPQIYSLQQLKEQKTKLNLIPTKGAAVLTASFVEEETKVLDSQILALESHLENHNNSWEIAA